MAKTFSVTYHFTIKKIKLDRRATTSNCRFYRGTLDMTDGAGATATHDFDIQAHRDHDTDTWNVGMAVYVGDTPLMVRVDWNLSIDNPDKYIKETYLKNE